MLVRTSLLALDQAARLHFSIGDGLELWLDDRRLGLRQDDRDIALRLTGEAVPDGLLAVHVRGQIGTATINSSFEPQANLFFRHVWDGLTETTADPDESEESAVPGTPANSLATELEIGWELAAEGRRPARIRWWRESVFCGGVDLRSLGCGGITPDTVHHLDVHGDVLWRGDGGRLTNAQRNSSGDLARLKISPAELAVSDGAHAHVFDTAGRFKRTLSALKGHVIAEAKSDDDGRVTSWTKNGHRYTIDRRNDSEALLRSPAGVWAVIDFDSHGRAVTVTDQDRTTAMLEWDHDGGLSKVIDSTGLESEIERDDLGRVIRFGDSTGKEMNLVRTDLDSGSEVTVITAEGRETTHRHEQLEDGTYVESHTCCGAGNARTVEYRSLGPLGEEQIVHSPNGTVATTHRSSRADASSAINVSRTSVVTPIGRAMHVERRSERYRSGRTNEHLTIGDSTAHRRLDPKNHSITTETAAGRMHKSVLNPGKSLSISHPQTGELMIEFDVNRRPKRRVLNDKVMTYGYDQNGRLTWTDFERWRQHVHHDEQGHVIAIETPDGWLQFARDVAGRVVATRSASESVTSIKRRPDGEIELIQYPESGTDDTAMLEAFAYDRDGLLIGRGYDIEHQIAYERDSVGRVASTTAPGVKITSMYDQDTGQLNEIATAEGDAVRFRYDGDLAWFEEAEGRIAGQIERAFGHDHRLIASRVNGQHQLSYARDADGLITAVGPLKIERNPAGLPIATHLGGLSTTREFDTAGRLVKHETRFGRMAEVFFSEEIERDEFGRVATITEHAQGTDRVISYTYGDARRLAQVDVDGEKVLALTYDANGNLTDLERQGRSLHMLADAADRLVQVAGQPTTYDSAGNLTGIGEDGSVRGYSFDGLSRLVGSQDARGNIEHTLDALGRPIEIDGIGAPVRMLWDGDQLAATLDARGNIDMRFIHSGTTVAPEAMVRNGTEYLLITDHLGSVRCVVDAHEGHVEQTLEYDAMGRILVNTSPGWQPFGFAGGLHEAASGLVRFRARTYDPFVGRFLGRDPLGFAGGQMNLYQYAHGDPINWVDPTGLRSTPAGEVSLCTERMLGSRPLSIDHVYLKTNAWRSGLGPSQTLGLPGRWITEYADDPAHLQGPCDTVRNIDVSCTTTFAPSAIDRGAIDMPWQTGVCHDAEWGALELCVEAGKWEFDSSRWNENPAAVETARRASSWMPHAARNAKRFMGSLSSNVADRVFG